MNNYSIVFKFVWPSQSWNVCDSTFRGCIGAVLFISLAMNRRIRPSQTTKFLTFPATKAIASVRNVLVLGCLKSLNTARSCSLYACWKSSPTDRSVSISLWILVFCLDTEPASLFKPLLRLTVSDQCSAISFDHLASCAWTSSFLNADRRNWSLLIEDAFQMNKARAWPFSKQG